MEGHQTSLGYVFGLGKRPFRLRMETGSTRYKLFMLSLGLGIRQLRVKFRVDQLKLR